jgi:hypothetical protein
MNFCFQELRSNLLCHSESRPLKSASRFQCDFGVGEESTPVLPI